MREDFCDVHSEHVIRIGRSERDIQEIWRAIDHMRYAVMAGMGAVVLQVVIFVIGKIG